MKDFWKHLVCSGLVLLLVVGCKKKPADIRQSSYNHLYTASMHRWAQTDTTFAAAVIQDSAIADPDTFLVGFFSDTIYARGVPVFLRTTYTDHKVYTGEISYQGNLSIWDAADFYNGFDSISLLELVPDTTGGKWSGYKYYGHKVY